MDDSPFMYFLFLLFQLAPGLLLLALAVKIDRRRRASGKPPLISSAGIGFRPTGPGGRWHGSAWPAVQSILEVSGALFPLVAFVAVIVTLLELLRVPFGR